MCVFLERLANGLGTGETERGLNQLDVRLILDRRAGLTT